MPCMVLPPDCPLRTAYQRYCIAKAEFHAPHRRCGYRPRLRVHEEINPHPEEPCAARRLEGWNESVPGSILRDGPQGAASSGSGPLGIVGNLDTFSFSTSNAR